MSIRIDLCLLLLGVAPPQHKYNGCPAFVQLVNNARSERFPTDSFVGVWLAATYGKNRIQQQYALLGPMNQMTVVWEWTAEISL